MKDFNTLFPKTIKENIVSSWVNPKIEAVYEPIPKGVTKETRKVLNSFGIKEIYRHQSESINYIYLGNNVVIATGTGSGKSLCYQIPLLDSLINDAESTSLLLFPTKALSADQFSKFSQFIKILDLYCTGGNNKYLIGVYDGDTSKS